MLKKVSIAGGLPIDIAPTDAVGFAILGGERRDRDRHWWPARATVVRPGRRRHASSHHHSRSNPEGEEIELRGIVPGQRRTCSSPACVLRRPGSKCSHERPGRGAGWCEAAATPSPASRVPASWSTRMPTRIFTVPVDPERLLPLGPPVPAIHGIDHYYRHANAAISDSGTLAFLPADGVREPELFWLDRAGTHHAGARRTGLVCRLCAVSRRQGGSLRACRRGDGRGVGPRSGARDDAAAGSEAIAVATRRSGAGTAGSSPTRGLARASSRCAESARTGRASRKPSSQVVPDIHLPRTGRRTANRCCSPSTPSRGDADVWLYSGGQADAVHRQLLSMRKRRGSRPMDKFVAFDADDGGESHVLRAAVSRAGPPHDGLHRGQRFTSLVRRRTTALLQPRTRRHGRARADGARPPPRTAATGCRERERSGAPLTPRAMAGAFSR